jgi:hypothetical protein
MLGKIYKIQSEGKTYYGSTFRDIRNRLSEHKYNARKKRNGCKANLLVLNNDCHIILVEELDIKTKKDLEERERWYIENNDCVNKIIPNQTCDEWYDKHKDKHNTRCMKRYYAKKDEILKRQKLRNKEKVKCECGLIVTRGSLSTHKKRKIHLNKI